MKHLQLAYDMVASIRPATATCFLCAHSLGAKAFYVCVKGGVECGFALYVAL